MSAVAAGTYVQRRPEFRNDLAELEASFPGVEKSVARFEDALRLEYELTHIPAGDERGAYVARVDYVVAGTAGVAQFRVLYMDIERSPDGKRVWAMLRIWSVM